MLNEDTLHVFRALHCYIRSANGRAEATLIPIRIQVARWKIFKRYTLLVTFCPSYIRQGWSFSRSLKLTFRVLWLKEGLVCAGWSDNLDYLYPSNSISKAAEAAACRHWCQFGAQEFFKGLAGSAQPRLHSWFGLYYYHWDFAVVKSAIDLCKSFQRKTKVRLYCTVGIHPHDASKHVSIQGLQAKLERLISDNRDVVVAVGECGLDYDRNFNSHAEQQNILSFNCVSLRKGTCHYFCMSENRMTSSQQCWENIHLVSVKKVLCIVWLLDP
jgi:TatD related DNase